MIAPRLLLVALVLGTASARCPNACSGHGTCGEFDMCTCYTNWQANDCSERTCPSGFAFVTTPQGDLNMDGDRYDNTQKLLVKVADGTANQGTINENDNILTLNQAIVTGEIVVGDAIRIADETFVVNSQLTEGSGTRFELDHDRYTSIIPEVNVYRFLETIPAPKGTWEMWQGDYYDGADEAHYYQECSNRGSCDRDTGTCECFDGYDGAACQRQQCANDCSGHGTCETVSELATLAPNKLTITAYTGPAYTDTFGIAGSNQVYPSVDATNSISVGDTIRLGTSDAQDLLVTAMATSFPFAITVATASDLPHGYGTAVYKVPKYDLWDASKDRACKCDGAFTGIDCSLRKCPRGDDPLTKYTSVTDTTAEGTTAVAQSNEKQTIYLETMRGSLSGSFKLTFTDAFGQSWTTTPINVNERLSSKAYVGSTTTQVTFSPALPYGELDAGDFLMIGDERHEVLTVLPDSATTQYRPIKQGGVVDTVIVANGFAASSTNVYGFRAGPAKGIKAALEALPNGVVPSVTTESLNGGTLIGYQHKGISTATSGSVRLGSQIASGSTTSPSSTTVTNTIKQTITTISGVHGDFDDVVGGLGTPSLATIAHNGGLAPYDTIRVTAANGRSEYVQLRNVDMFPTGEIEALHAKGTLGAQGAYDATTSPGLIGIGQGKQGTIFRAGGYAVRVSFNSNSGDLDEMEVDTSGLYSVFVREFAADVLVASPRKVSCRLHGGARFSAREAFKYPVPYSDGETDQAANVAYSDEQAADVGLGDGATFKGDEYGLKVMAGMKVKIGDQVRTVVTDIASDFIESAIGKIDVAAEASGDLFGSSPATASFLVDEPFVKSDVSQSVDGVEYLFYQAQVEQLYDEASYNALTISQAIYAGADEVKYLGFLVGEVVGGYTNANTARDIAPGTKTGTSWNIARTKPASGGDNNGFKHSGLCTTSDTGRTETCYYNPNQYYYANLLTAGTIMTCSGTESVEGGRHDQLWNRVYAIRGSSHEYDAGASAAFDNVAFVVLDTNVDLVTATSNFGPSGDATGADNGLADTFPYRSAAGTGVCRIHSPMSSLASGKTLGVRAPPLHSGYRTRWATVTDQRPLVWNNPQVDKASLSAVTISPSLVAYRGVVGSQSSAVTLMIDATSTGACGGVCTQSTGYGMALGGHTTATENTKFSFLGYNVGTGILVAASSNFRFFSISGCSSNSAVNREYKASAGWVSSGTSDEITTTENLATLLSISVDNKICAGNTVTITNRMASLVDSKAIAVGDRVKFFVEASSTYETRSVDKIWGSNLDVTMFSVADAYSTTTFTSAYAWVDEKGSTEDLECGRRGLCAVDSGVCECFSGYTGQACGTQNALAS